MNSLHSENLYDEFFLCKKNARTLRIDSNPIMIFLICNVIGGLLLDFDCTIIDFKIEILN